MAVETVGTLAAALAGISGEIPDSIDSDKAMLVIYALLAVCVVGVFFVVRTVQKAVTRLVLVLILVGAGAGLWMQRQDLRDCSGQCTCHLFGRDYRVPDPRGGCP